MHILINGGTGFIGSRLSNYFIGLGFNVSILTRNIHKIGAPKSATLIDKLDSKKGNYDVIINLAGEPLNGKRWNDEVKQNLYESRIKSTEKIVTYIEGCDVKPKVLITGSAIGFYGSSLSEKFTEDTTPADHSFTQKMCADWELAGMKASEYGVRVCVIRTGIVLDQHHGALTEMLPPFRLGLGAQLGDGDQWMSWIHINDVVGAVGFLMNNPDLSGPFNLAAPNAVTNAQFTKQVAKVVKKPSFLKLPPFMVRFLFGEMADALLLKGQRVVPHNLVKAGYQFQFPTLGTALNDVLGPKE